MSLPATVQAGNRRASLEAIRNWLANALVGAEGRDIAPLAKELRAVIAELDALPGGREESKSDDLVARRAARRANARKSTAAAQ